MNPRSPAPQASVLILTSGSGTRIQGNSPIPDTMTRLRAHSIGVKHEHRIINTLLQMKNEGRAENTLKTTSQELNQLSKHTDLMITRQSNQYCNNNQHWFNDLHTFLLHIFLVARPCAHISMFFCSFTSARTSSHIEKVRVSFSLAAISIIL